MIDEVTALNLPWREKRSVLTGRLASMTGRTRGEASKALAGAFPAMTTNKAMAQLRRRPVLEGIGLSSDLIDAWLDTDADGLLEDEVRARFEGVPAKYGHVIVDEAQDMSLLQLRAVRRRSRGITLVGDDAQKSSPWGLGLTRCAAELGIETAELTTAYRMSAEIAGWLNEHAERHGIAAVRLEGIRPNGIAVATVGDADREARTLRERWSTVAVIGADDVWEHKGVEYDAVVVKAGAMDPAQIYLAASRAAHQLCIAT